MLKLSLYGLQVDLRRRRLEYSSISLDCPLDWNTPSLGLLEQRVGIVFDA